MSQLPEHVQQALKNVCKEYGCSASVVHEKGSRVLTKRAVVKKDPKRKLVHNTCYTTFSWANCTEEDIRIVPGGRLD